jgi:hypothetical protein
MAERPGKSMNEVSQVHLYVLRFFYAVLGIWQTIIQAPLFFHHEHWTQTSAVVHSFFLALALLSLIGIRSPLQMLPLLIYEILWKMIWLLGVALPLWLANQLDADTLKALPQIAPVVILIPFIPWRYFFAKYLVQIAGSS